MNKCSLLFRNWFFGHVFLALGTYWVSCKLTSYQFIRGTQMAYIFEHLIGHLNVFIECHVVTNVHLVKDMGISYAFLYG